MEKESVYDKVNYKNNNRIKSPNNLIFENYISNNRNSSIDLSNKYYNSSQFKNRMYINQNIINNNLKDEKGLLFNLNRKEDDYQRKKEKEEYRKDLLKQIEDNERRKKERKRQLEEENKLNEIKNMKYLMYKQKQEEEFEKIRKMNNNKRMKSQFNDINQENSIYNNNNNKKRENIKVKEVEKDIKTKKREEREREEITNNYNRIVRMNYYNMFEEKEELKDYINKEFNDYLYILDDETEYEKNRKIKNINEELPMNYNNRYQNENNRYNVHRDIIHKYVDKENKMNYDKISDVNEIIKSYKVEIRPSIYFNHEIDTLLNSYSNLIMYKNDKEINYINKKINKLSNDIKKNEKEESQTEDIEKEKEKSNIPDDIEVINNKDIQNETSNENIDESNNEKAYDNYLIF